MADFLNATLVGDKELITRMTEMGPAVQQALYKDVTVLSIQLQGIVLGKLHGPVLNQRSGRLAASIQQRVEQSGAAVFGYVFSSGDVKYAAFWEYGFTGSENVRAHTRMVSQVFGRAVPTFEQHVSAHSRQVNQPARSYMRSSLADMASTIQTRLTSTVVETMRNQVMGR